MECIVGTVDGSDRCVLTRRDRVGGPVPWVVVAVTVKVQPCHFLAASVAVL